MEATIPPVMPAEGLHVLHAFFRLDSALWESFSDDGRREAMTRLTEVAAETRAEPGTQLLTFSMVSPKADVGFMVLARDLHALDRAGKRLGGALGAGVLEPVFSWLSMTERSEYTTSEADYAESLQRDERLAPESLEFGEKMTAFRERIEKYTKDRLEPNMPDWPVFCFYPMSKRRVPGQNWYALPFEDRKRLMAGHAKVGRTYAGRVRQLITGSTGLDDGEWGVTLFAKSTSEIKSIVYEMRFDEVSAHYADFGEFFIGLQLPLDALFERLGL